MNILVTGANGQLGKCFFDVVDNDHHKKHNFFFTGREDLDIRKRDDIIEYIEKNNIDAVINFAAYTNVEQAEDDINGAFLANSFAPSLFAELMKDRGGIFIHISTDYVYHPYEGWDGSPFDEDCIDFEYMHKTSISGSDKLCVYGSSKLAGESVINLVGGNYLIIRTSWLYSAYGNNFVTKVLKKIENARSGEKLKFVCDQVGTPTCAHSLATFIYSLINYDDIKFYLPNVLNYSDKGVCSWYDFAKAIHEHGIWNTYPVIEPCYSDEFVSKVKRPHYSVMSKRKLRTVFEDFDNTRDWRENLVFTLGLIEENNEK